MDRLQSNWLACLFDGMNCMLVPVKLLMQRKKCKAENSMGTSYLSIYMKEVVDNYSFLIHLFFVDRGLGLTRYV